MEAQDQLNAISQAFTTAYPTQAFDPSQLAQHVKLLITTNRILESALQSTIEDQRVQEARIEADVAKMEQELHQYLEITINELVQTINTALLEEGVDQTVIAFALVRATNQVRNKLSASQAQN